MEHPLPNGRGTLTVIADNGDRFRAFAPYVAAINDQGVVAFQAGLQAGGEGIFTGSGGPVDAVAVTSGGHVERFSSHPDINARGAVSVYCGVPSGQAVLLVLDGQTYTVATTGDALAGIGPLGPTMNDRGAVAFRAEMASGHHGIFAGDEGSVVAIADTRRFRGFHGLPVIDRTGRVVFRADLDGGEQGIYGGRGGALDVIADTNGPFAQLGAFPSASDSGTVVFAATLKRGGAGIYTASGGGVRAVIETNDDFETFRGGLINDTGMVVFYAAARGGPLGVYAGPDPVRDRIVALGDPLFGSTVVDFALNPVSMNSAGQVAMRVQLANGRQLIVRVSPQEAT